MNFDERINQLRNYVVENNLDAILISSVFNIAYLTNFLKFSKEERDAYILITKKDSFLVTNSLYANAFSDKKWPFKLKVISQKHSTKEILQSVSGIKIVAVEEDDLRAREYKNLENIYEKLVPFNFGQFRSIKDKSEIELLETACRIGDKAFELVLKKIKAGITEKELAIQLQIEILKLGADISFPPIVAFGKNSSIPHHQTGNDQLKNGQIILMDFGAEYQGYCSDMTRTVFKGKASKKQQTIYQAVSIAQKKAVEYIKDCLEKKISIKASLVDEAARQSLISQGFPDIPHSVGHGIGLEVHERPYISPRNEEILRLGMVFSIEPGMYLPGIGGVRIEDLYLLEENNLKRLTKANSNLLIV